MYVFLRFLRFFQNPKKHDFLRFFELLHTFSRTMVAGDCMRSKMMTQAEKQAKEGSLSLNKEAKRRRLDTDIDYKKCVVCQGLDAKGIYNITSTGKLVLAMNARQDETFKRLKHDSAYRQDAQMAQ